MPISSEEWADLREDVGYIKARIEVVTEHEQRIRDLEKSKWMFSGIAALVGALSGFFHS